MLHYIIWEYVQWHKCCRNVSVKLHYIVDHTALVITLLSIHNMSNTFKTVLYHVCISIISTDS